MTPSRDSPEIDLLRRCFDAWSSEDFTPLEDALAGDARWTAAIEGAPGCEGRETIIELMRRNTARRGRGNIEEMVQFGSRILVAFRPATPGDLQERPLDRGLAYLVVTISDGEITELRGCADRAAALGYAHSDQSD
jgi:ketosteroid isomerase-like protein